MTGNNVGLLFSSRLFIATMCFLGVLFMITARLNMSVAIVCMVNHTAMYSDDDGIDFKYQDTHIENRTSYYLNGTFHNKDHDLPSEHQRSTCGANNESDPDVTRTDGPFLWTKQHQGAVLGAYFWGYLFFQVPSGWTVRKFGSVRMLAISTLVASALSLLTPLLAPYSYVAVAVLRAGIGFVAGMICPSVHNLLSNWLPPTERAILGSFAYSGFSFGALTTFTGSGLLCEYGFADGWQSIFYVFGGLGILFTVAWYLLVNESPAHHKRISKEEKLFIQRNMEEMKEGKPLDTPWKAIMTSLPVWAVLFSAIANDFYGIIMWLFLPTYLKDVMNFDISSNGVISSLPYILQFFTLLFVGCISDVMLVKGWLSISAVRKLYYAIGSVICIVSVIAVGFMDCDQATLAVVFIMTSIGSFGFMTIGYYVNPLDIAPSYSGLIIALANTIGTVAGVISPYIVSGITGENPSRESWQIIFILAAIVLAVALIFHAIFASGDIQPWARGSSDGKINFQLDVDLDIQFEDREDNTNVTVESKHIAENGSVQSSLMA